MDFIKEIYFEDKIRTQKKEKVIKEIEICGKIVSFILLYKKVNREGDFASVALYYPRLEKGKYKIEISLTFYNDFGQSSFRDIYFRLKNFLYHEIEHHYQKMRVPFREKLPKRNYLNLKDYLNSKSEIEAYSKSLYYIHKKTKISFTDLLIEECRISYSENMQDLFISNVFDYLLNRKDLNLFKNIKF